MKQLITIAFATGLALLGGCAARKAPSASVPAIAARPATVAIDPAAESMDAEQSQSLPAELEIGAERVVVPPLQPGTLSHAEEASRISSEPEAELAPAKQPRRPQPGTARRSDTEASNEAEPSRPEPRMPSLTPMMSGTERRQLENQIQAHLERARRNLANIQDTRLEMNERQALQQARSFLARAEQLRNDDPAMANSLAERAAILSQELLRKQR